MAKKPLSDDVAKLLGEEKTAQPAAEEAKAVNAEAEGLSEEAKTTNEEAAETAAAQPKPKKAKKPATPVADDDDGVLAAHLRRQESWAEDAAKIFRGPSREETERQELLAELSKRDAERMKELRKAEEEKAAAEAAADLAARQKRAAELRAEADALEGV